MPWGYMYYPGDIEEIISMDNQEKIYERGFVGRGGEEQYKTLSRF